MPSSCRNQVRPARAMLPSMETAPSVLPLLLLLTSLTANAFGQAPRQTLDITGWESLHWGTAKPIALKTLRPLGVHECNAAKLSCAEAAGVETLLIDRYVLNTIPFRISLVFSPKNGLSKATLTAEDKRDAFEKTLALFTTRYGKPGLQSEYDGDTEQTYTTWVWAKPHGKVSLGSDEATGLFTITYEGL
jgi:hypothetical protein